MTVVLERSRELIYPESDGQPMADNSRQFLWITVLYGNLAALFRDDPNVFVCGNQNWFPREGEPDYCKAPDVYVVFGRPKGHRGSWKQWEEGDVPLTVVFEILSPANSAIEMAKKLAFYDENGVEEYYLYDPDKNQLAVYVRGQMALRLIWFVGSFVSPRLGIRFDLTGPEMRVFYPDGRPFLSFEELEAQRLAEEQKRLAAEQALQSEAERRLAAEQKRLAAEQKLQSAERIMARVAELTAKLLRQEATPEELAELQRLTRQTP